MEPIRIETPIQALKGCQITAVGEAHGYIEGLGIRDWGLEPIRIETPIQALKGRQITAVGAAHGKIKKK